ncbi:Dbl homology domain-containing protein [Spinellus fusiger]|nr:Dbl homology domain-containing protein [Spinellus fusiger]
MDKGQGTRAEEDALTYTKKVNGLFTLLTDCYSPTCTRDSPCYSYSCPRTTRKIKRLRSDSTTLEKQSHGLWCHSIPKHILDSVSSKERKRQECIHELIYTEEDFVKDLYYIQNTWIQPLITSDIVPIDRRDNFIQQVFWNIKDIVAVNDRLCEALVSCKQQGVISHIGDSMLKYASLFAPFVAYGAHQVIGKFNFELEKKRNARFARFVEETERKPESRRLELNGYLTKPTARLGRYNLLFREILNSTAKDNPDQEYLPRVMAMITEHLVKMNQEIGKSENKFHLQQIHTRLAYKPMSAEEDLHLLDQHRQLIMKGRMRRKGNATTVASDMKVFLFDHYLVFAKIKYHNHLEFYKVYRKPVPLDCLDVCVPDSRAKLSPYRLSYNKRLSVTTPAVTTGPLRSAVSDLRKSRGYAIAFTCHCKGGSFTLTLYNSSASTQMAWIERIHEQQKLLET